MLCSLLRLSCRKTISAQEVKVSDRRVMRSAFHMLCQIPRDTNPTAPTATMGKSLPLLDEHVIFSALFIFVIEFYSSMLIGSCSLQVVLICISSSII